MLPIEENILGFIKEMELKLMAMKIIMKKENLVFFDLTFILVVIVVVAIRSVITGAFFSAELIFCGFLFVVVVVND